MKKTIVFFLLINSLIFASQCNGGWREDSIFLIMTLDSTISNIQVAKKSKDIPNLKLYKKDLKEPLNIIDHILNDHKEALSYDTIELLEKMKQDTTKAYENLEKDIKKLEKED
ncbi:hypothetical protein [Fusobacterium sp. FSA-380-WT-3A]|uniref:hypothetical protein n=1 Tax=Fusobacterium sp. FSA-380-WT-3A TaxID=2725304 RepID=UPI0014772573|nr:hypothetical protein [Fusobacterium sp. FSA-380-WT-3A]NME36524.1 hypothetical protein [Fusobacterium sp. FSA-380-WT-3A]